MRGSAIGLRSAGPMPRTERRRATPPRGKGGGADFLCNSGKPGNEPSGDVRDGATAREGTLAEVSWPVNPLPPPVGGGVAWPG
jgi:hypothetical protein